MGRRGPVGQPPELRALRGYPVKVKLNVPQPVKTPPEPPVTPPDHLDAHERRLFVKAMEGRRATDAFAVGRWATYAAALERAIAARRWHHVQELEPVLLRLEDRLGMNPKARLRLQGGP